MASGSNVVEEGKSSDDSRTHDEEFSDVETPPEDDDSGKTPPPPVLSAQDVNMSPQGQNDDQYDPDGSDHNSNHDGSDRSGSDDSDDDEEDFPACFPDDPPFVEQMPTIEYPVDAPRSSPSARNLDFNRMVQNNFVPFQKGMKGDAYRKRTNYEHQKVMG